MGSNYKTLGDLAAALEMSQKEIAKHARRILNLSDSESRDRHYNLSLHQWDRMARELGKPKPEEALTESKTRPAPQKEDERQKYKEDPRSSINEMQFGEMNYPIQVHEDVLSFIDKHYNQAKRLKTVLLHFGAIGRTTSIKSCSPPNQGWFRTPMSGGKYHYYLWWTQQGNKPTKSERSLPERSILLREIRHHDDHRPLSVDDYLNKYLEFTQKDILDDSNPQLPVTWTEKQLKFIDSKDPIRLMNGSPGSGKTTALLRCIDTRCKQNVLFLTYSQDLATMTRKYAKVYAPKTVACVTRDFISFLSEINGQQISRIGLQEMRRRFTAAVPQNSPKLLGKWNGKESALCTEIRGYLLGRATDITGEYKERGSFRYLSNKTYKQLRGNSENIGLDAAQAVLRLFPKLTGDWLNECFPEFAAAVQAIQKLRDGELPEGYKKIDKIIVDEIQDLTLIELEVIIELCRAIGREEDYAPILLLAGDDGQTVRPSGFDWGRVNDLISSKLGKPRDFPLAGSLRCPDGIAKVLQRSSSLYKKLNKKDRPTKQYESMADHVGAQIQYVNVETEDEVEKLFETLQEISETVIVTPWDELPHWIPEKYKGMVRIPEEVKGLEYQSVCILDPGKLLEEIDGLPPKSEIDRLEACYYRTLLDQFRVAISRSTEKLTFIDYDANPTRRKLSLRLLGQPVIVDPAGLAELLEDSDLLPEDRVRSRLSEARHLIEENPYRAWQQINQAYRLLGDKTLPNGVTDDNLRIETKETFLELASRVLLSRPKQPSRKEIHTETNVVLEDLGSEKHREAFDMLYRWSSKRGGYPFDLLDTVLAMENNDWIVQALNTVRQSVQNAIVDGAKDVAVAHLYRGNVEGWLEIIHYAGDIYNKAMSLRYDAFDTLLEENKLEEAGWLEQSIEPEDDRIKGRLYEAEERYGEAAEAFYRIDAYVDALRNFRFAGDWNRAAPLAKDGVAEDLQWIIQLEDILKNRPAGLENRLTDAEKQKLQTLVQRIV